MSKVWEVAEAVLNKRGWKMVGPKLEKLVYSMWKVNEEEEDLQCDWMYSLDTHARSGEFSEMVVAGENKVTEKAKGRKIWWLNDLDGEWMHVTILFGTEKELTKKAQAVIDESQKSRNDKVFHDQLSVEQVDALGEKFGGKKTELGKRSCLWFTREDGRELHFTAVGGVGDGYNEGPRIRFMHKDVTKSEHPMINEIYFNRIGQLEVFIDCLPEDHHIETFEESDVKYLRDLLKRTLGQNIKHRESQRTLYFNSFSISREKVGEKKGRIYVSLCGCQYPICDIDAAGKIHDHYCDPDPVSVHEALKARAEVGLSEVKKLIKNAKLELAKRKKEQRDFRAMLKLLGKKPKTTKIIGFKPPEKIVGLPK